MELVALAYLPFIANTTTSRITINKKVLITSKMGTIASSFPLGAARAGGASLGASTLGGANLGASNLGAGAGAGAANVGAAIAGIATEGMGGGANGTAATGAGGGGGAATGCFALRPEIMRVNSPGPPESAGGGAAAGDDGNTGSGGASRCTCDNRWISLVTPPASAPVDSVADGAAGAGV